METEVKTRRKKLIGVELMRGIAAFAVVLSHSGDGSWGEMSQGVLELRSFFSFHVPFFLAISFYFLSKKSFFVQKNVIQNSDLKLRIQRIIFPYLIWSFIYLIFRSIFFFGMGQNGKIASLYGDIPSIFLFGGASYHLYFLPMLLTGTFTLYAVNQVLKDWNLIKILVFLAIGFLARIIILITGNHFQLGPDIAFQAFFDQIGVDPYHFPLRLTAVYLVWIVTCLPYIGVALLFNFLESRLKEDNTNKTAASSTFFSNSYSLLGASTVAFLMATFLVNSTPMLRPFQKLTVAFSLVVMAIAFSHTLLKNETAFGRVAITLGKCSLGIYLIHPLIIRFTRLVIGKIHPVLLSQVSVGSILMISSVSFLISWLLVYGLVRNKYTAHYLI